MSVTGYSTADSFHSPAENYFSRVAIGPFMLSCSERAIETLGGRYGCKVGPSTGSGRTEVLHVALSYADNE